MFNGPCRLHGSAGFMSTADEALISPGDYMNAGVSFDDAPLPPPPLPHGLRLHDAPASPTITAAAAAAAAVAGEHHSCPADRCLMNPGVTCPDVYMALEGIQFMAEHTRREQYTIRVAYYTLAYRAIVSSVTASRAVALYTLLFLYIKEMYM